MAGRLAPSETPAPINPWVPVFELLTAYELASLYFSGAKDFQELMRKHVTRFTLFYNAHRRIAWPKNFLPLFPALQHVVIGGHDEHSYPRVPDIDVRLLPTGLITLELHIANGLLSVLDPSKMEELAQKRIHLLPFKTLYPNLQKLEWKSLLNDTDAALKMLSFKSLPHQASLRSLKVSLTAFSVLDFDKFPTTLEELSIDTSNWVVNTSENPTQLPPHLTRLELYHVSTYLKLDAWPQNLTHLHLDFDSESWVLPYSIDRVLRESPKLPSGLKSFYLNAPMYHLSVNLCEMIPEGIRDLRLYGYSTNGEGEPEKSFAKKIPTLQNLVTLHFCLSQPGFKSDTPFVRELPPSLIDFVVTTGPNARQPWEVAEMPKSLRTLSSMPSTTFGLQHRQKPRGHIDLSCYPREALHSFPNSLLELQDSIVGYQSFPKTLTRLSLQTYSNDGIPTKFDLRAVRLPPNITDLTLGLDNAFDILKLCEGLPLVSLNVDFGTDKLYEHEIPKGFDRDAATSFEFSAFPRLKTLHFNPRFLVPPLRGPWLQRLPASLTELSLVPARMQWQNDIPPPYYLESWIIFRNLPRSLQKFTACVSDLHFQEVFSMLPDGLTELYLCGKLEAGAFGIVELAQSMQNLSFYEPIELDYLPLSLTKLMMPERSLEAKTYHSFFASRPQLSLTVTWVPGLANPPDVMPTAYVPPPTLDRMRVGFRDRGIVLDNLELSLQYQQTLPGEGTFPWADVAVRAPPTNVRDVEASLRHEATMKLAKGETAEGIHIWLYSKREKLKKAQEKQGSKEGSKESKKEGSKEEPKESKKKKEGKKDKEKAENCVVS